MHIAICDDNIAERKQTERLMKREADRMIAEGDTMYIDSFGNIAELSRTPMIYDAFLVDIRHTEGVSSLDVITTLRDKGVTAPICVVFERDSEASLTPSKNAFPPETPFLAKPIRQEELHDLITEIRKSMLHAVSSIELRNEEKTLYITEDEFIYAQQSGLNTLVTLTKGREMEVRGSAASLFDEITKEHECFIMPSISSILNLKFIDRLQMRKAYLKDGSVFKIDRSVLPYVKAYLNGSL